MAVTAVRSMGTCYRVEDSGLYVVSALQHCIFLGKHLFVAEACNVPNPIKHRDRRH